MYMLYVSLPYATFGLDIDNYGVVAMAAPIANYTVGWTAQRAIKYFKAKEALVIYIWPDGSSYAA